MTKNVQTAEQLCWFHMLGRLCSKSFKAGFSNTWTKNFQKYKLDLEKAKEAEIKLPTVIGWWRKQGNPRKTSTSASLTILIPLTVDHSELWKILKERWEYQTALPVSWETCMQVKKQQIKSYMEQLTGWKFGKKYNKAIYSHPAYLTSM